MKPTPEELVDDLIEKAKELASIESEYRPSLEKARDRVIVELQEARQAVLDLLHRQQQEAE